MGYCNTKCNYYLINNPKTNDSLKSGANIIDVPKITLFQMMSSFGPLGRGDGGRMVHKYKNQLYMALVLLLYVYYPVWGLIDAINTIDID